MKKVIDVDKIKKVTDVSTYLNILWYSLGLTRKDFNDITDKNVNQNLIIECDDVCVPTNLGLSLLSKVNNVDNVKYHTDNEYINLASQLHEIYPSGYKPDEYGKPSNTPWRESVDIIADRLKTLETKIYKGKLDFDMVVKATDYYIKQNINNPYARTLGYFIWKTKRGEFNEKTSDLLTYIDIIKSGKQITESNEGTSVTNIAI